MPRAPSTEQRFRALVSGETTGLRATLIRALLSLASFGYGLAIRLRNAFYDWRVSRVNPSELPVVSLGNLTTGGTGKTPLAAFLARWFRDRHVRVCFLSRGYGAGDSALNDEALVLERLCPDVPHLQNPDRVASARIAREELASQLLILDDGFQHRRLARNLDLVLIDALNPWGYRHLLPRGLLREPPSSLRRADLALITRADLITPDELSRLRTEITRLAPHLPIAEVALVADQLVNWTGQAAPPSLGPRVGAVSAIGNPESFRRTLQNLGITAPVVREFPDHHRYTRDDVRDLCDWARRERLDAVCTTRKDLVKLQLDDLGGVPLWCVDQRVELRAGADHLAALLTPLLAQIPPEAADEPDDET